MIRDLSHTLQAMLTQRGLPAELAAARIAFDRPGEGFTPQQTTLDLFLYDIRENLELRNAEPVLERVNGHAVRRRPPLRVDCTYLVTAWPVGGEELALQEHRLLAQVLQVFARYPTIHPSFLQDSLKGQTPPLPLITSRTDRIKEPAEFWSAIGGPLRPSLSATVTIGMELFDAEEFPLVTTDTIRLGRRVAGERRLLPEPGDRVVGGRVLGGDGAAIAGASVALIEAGLSGKTDADGHYVIGPVVPGRYTLRVVQPTGIARTMTITVPLPARSRAGGYDVRFRTPRVPPP
jgi:hypothetical protein